MTNRNLYIVVCGAPLASRPGHGVRAARANGWDPYVIPTDAAAPWLADQDLGDAPVITGNRNPGEPKRIPPADAVAVVPMTFNTLNAWANGNAPRAVRADLSTGANIDQGIEPVRQHIPAHHPVRCSWGSYAYGRRPIRQA